MSKALYIETRNKLIVVNKLTAVIIPLDMKSFSTCVLIANLFYKKEFNPKIYSKSLIFTCSAESLIYSSLMLSCYNFKTNKVETPCYRYLALLMVNNSPSVKNKYHTTKQQQKQQNIALNIVVWVKNRKKIAHILDFKVQLG